MSSHLLSVSYSYTCVDITLQGALPLKEGYTSCPEFLNQRSQVWFPSPVATLAPGNWTEIRNLELDLRLPESEIQMERERPREAL